ncbi:MAG: hypothetical protein H6842_06880 [Rhodospirillaceae bacterium]|nr:hypothetical protein [Rhodospirillaceae bacterium]
MRDVSQLGLSRRDLEYHLRWMLRRMPKDPAKMPEFVGQIVVTLIEKNNAAIAKSLGDEERADLPETS